MFTFYNTKEKLIDDLKKFKGLPPYDDWSNICMGDGYFWHDIQKRYTKTEIEETEIEIKKGSKNG